jgi:hypothetical protein
MKYCPKGTSQTGKDINILHYRPMPTKDLGEEIHHIHLRLSVPLTQSSPCLFSLRIQSLPDAFITRNKSRPERLRSHILSIRIRKNVNRNFIALSSAIATSRRTCSSSAGLISNAHRRRQMEVKRPCSARGCPLHCRRPNPKVLYPRSFGYGRRFSTRYRDGLNTSGSGNSLG